MSVMAAWMTTTLRSPRMWPQLVRSEGIRLKSMMPVQVTTVAEAMTGRACRHGARASAIGMLAQEVQLLLHVQWLAEAAGTVACSVDVGHRSQFEGNRVNGVQPMPVTASSRMR